MASTTPSPPWKLACPWCEYTINVFGRGGSGADQGAGVEAADLMKGHIAHAHKATWDQFLAATDG